MKTYWRLIFLTSILLAHDPDKENLKWRHYYRLGTVYSQMPKIGAAGYARLKRTTKNTFKDIRFFGHVFENDTEIRIRQKSSRRFLSLKQFYSFNTLIYEKNTIINVDLRYHYNQGLGYIIKNNNSGNTTLEMGVAFDNSDYLNTEQKTTYARAGCSTDHALNFLSAKFEIDYFYQLSEVINSKNLSRFQILTEAKWDLNGKVGLIAGFTCDIQNKNPDPSFFLTISFNEVLNWIF